MNEQQRQFLHRLQLGGCICMTKTPELKYHAEDCQYRLASEIEAALAQREPQYNVEGLDQQAIDEAIAPYLPQPIQRETVAGAAVATAIHKLRNSGPFLNVDRAIIADILENTEAARLAAEEDRDELRKGNWKLGKQIDTLRAELVIAYEALSKSDPL